MARFAGKIMQTMRPVKSLINWLKALVIPPSEEVGPERDLPSERGNRSERSSIMDATKRELLWMKYPRRNSGEHEAPLAFGLGGGEEPLGCCDYCWICKGFCLCDSLDICWVNVCVIH